MLLYASIERLCSGADPGLFDSGFKFTKKLRFLLFFLTFLETRYENEIIWAKRGITETSPYSFRNFRKLLLYNCCMPI